MSDRYQERLQRARNNPYTMPDLSQTLNPSHNQTSMMAYGDKTMKSFTRLGINQRKYSKNSFKSKKVNSQQKQIGKDFAYTQGNDYFFDELKDTERAFKTNTFKDTQIEEEDQILKQFFNLKKEYQQLKKKYAKEKEDNKMKDKLIQEMHKKITKIQKKNENLKKQNEKQQKNQQENLKKFQEEVLKFELNTQQNENNLKNQIIDLEGFKTTTQEFFEDFRPLLKIIQNSIKNFFNNFQQNFTNLQQDKIDKIIENFQRLQNLVELFGSELQLINNMQIQQSESDDFFNDTKKHLPTFSKNNPSDMFQL